MARVLAIEPGDRAAETFVDLQLSGHEVTVTSSGASALDVVPSINPDVILIDWVMEDMSAIDFVQEIKARGLFAKVRLLLVTNEGDENNILRAFQAGIDGYVPKPVDLDVLQGAINRVVRSPADALADRRAEELRKARLFRALEDLLGE